MGIRFYLMFSVNSRNNAELVFELESSVNYILVHGFYRVSLARKKII